MYNLHVIKHESAVNFGYLFFTFLSGQTLYMDKPLDTCRVELFKFNRQAKSGTKMKLNFV